MIKEWFMSECHEQEERYGNWRELDQSILKHFKYMENKVKGKLTKYMFWEEMTGAGGWGRPKGRCIEEGKSLLGKEVS